MSTNNMYFNYDNDKEVYVLPVLPEELQLTIKGQTASVTIDSFGEVLHKGKRDGMIIKFSSFFPADWGSFCSCSKKEFKEASEWHEWMMWLQEADKPCHFVYTNAPAAINIYADITSYMAKEQGGDPGTIYYTVELKEHRNPTVRQYTKKVSANATKVTTTTGKRVNNSAKTYKYKCTAGIGLNLRSKKWGTILTCIPYNAVVTADGKKDGDWLHVCYKKTWGYASPSYLVKC